MMKLNKKDYLVYLIECKDSTYYCGITTDLARRLIMHANGTGAKYCRGRGPFKILTTSKLMSKSDALKLENEVKQKRKTDKLSFLLSESN